MPRKQSTRHIKTTHTKAVRISYKSCDSKSVKAIPTSRWWYWPNYRYWPCTTDGRWKQREFTPLFYRSFERIIFQRQETCLILVFAHSTAFARNAAVLILVLSCLARYALNRRAWSLYRACWAGLAYKGNPCAVNQFGGECACRDIVRVEKRKPCSRFH
jgi:hypothetical protein